MELATITQVNCLERYKGNEITLGFKENIRNNQNVINYWIKKYSEKNNEEVKEDILKSLEVVIINHKQLERNDFISSLNRYSKNNGFNKLNVVNLNKELSNTLNRKMYSLENPTNRKYLPNTATEFLSIFNSKNIRKTVKNIKSEKDNLKIKTPTLISVKRAYGEDKANVIIQTWLIDLNKSLNLRTKLKDEQLEETADFIMEDYKNLSIGDIKVIFERAKKGWYGVLYENLSMDKILSWFRDYSEKKEDEAGELSRRRHEENVKGANKKAIVNQKEMNMLNKLGTAFTNARRVAEK